MSLAYHPLVEDDLADAADAYEDRSPGLGEVVFDERERLLRAIAQGLADDTAGRTMDTKELKESLERKVGPIAWP